MSVRQKVSDLFSERFQMPLISAAFFGQAAAPVLEATDFESWSKEIGHASNFVRCTTFHRRHLIESAAAKRSPMACSTCDLFLITLHRQAAQRYSRVRSNAPPESDEHWAYWRRMMNQDQTESATIYQFPVGGRNGKRLARDLHRPSIEALPRVSALAVGESWYHAEAIQDADKAKP